MDVLDENYVDINKEINDDDRNEVDNDDDSNNVISLVDSNMEINVVKNDIECYEGHKVFETNVESDDTGCNDKVNIIKSDIIHSITENFIADVCIKGIKIDSVIDKDTMVINDKDDYEEIFRLDSSNKVLNAVKHDQLIVSDFSDIRKSIVNRVSNKAVGHVRNDLSRNAVLGQDMNFNLRCMSLIRFLLVFLLVILSLYRSNSVYDDKLDFHGGFVFNRGSVVISGRLMMIHNHTSYSNKYITKRYESNEEFPYVLHEGKCVKRYILWNKRYLLLWSGDSTRYEYRDSHTNIKVKLYVFLKLYSVCPSLWFSLVSDASDSVVGIALTQGKDDDGTHSHIVRFTSTRARQLFFEKEIYGILFRLSHSHLLVVFKEGDDDMNDNPLSEYSSVMYKYHINIQNIEYLIFNLLSPAEEPCHCVDMLQWRILISISFRAVLHKLFEYCNNLQ